MVMEYILFFVGLFILVKGARWIVDGSSSLAKRLGVSTLIVGLTVVAFGTSLPELIVNILAALGGSGEIAFGNVIGSNISNILLILGITAIVGKVRIKNSTIWRQIPFALLAAFILFLLTNKMLFGIQSALLTRMDGLIFLALFAIFLYYLFQVSRKEGAEMEEIWNVDKGMLKIALKIVIGLVAIYFGGRWVVDGAVVIAGQLGLSEFLISATVIAIGTSLPELVVSIIAVLNKKVDLAVGNIIGSNIFNILWVLGIVPLIRPIAIPAFIGFDIAVMFFATLLLFIFMFTGRHELRRKEGVVFVLLYVLYIAFLIFRG